MCGCLPLHRSVAVARSTASGLETQTIDEVTVLAEQRIDGPWSEIPTKSGAHRRQIQPFGNVVVDHRTDCCRYGRQPHRQQRSLLCPNGQPRLLLSKGLLSFAASFRSRGPALGISLRTMAVELSNIKTTIQEAQFQHTEEYIRLRVSLCRQKQVTSDMYPVG